MNKKVPNVIFCRGGYMKYYRGISVNDKGCVKGGSYNNKNIGHECYNFYRYKNGKCYGFVQSKNRKLDIDRIASDTSSYDETDREYIDCVTVIFVANGTVVGFYKNAIAYRDLQKITNPAMTGFDDYFFECDSHNAVLIAEKDRPQFPIKQGRTNWFGQYNIFYADSSNIYDDVVDIINHVLAYKQPYLNNDAQEDSVYQDEVNSEYVKANTMTSYKKELRHEPVIVDGREVYLRDAKMAKEVLVINQFKCEIDGKHEAFKKKNSNELYAEAHHIVPMSKQTDYPYSLDVKANIACLCSNCHRKIHYGADAPDLIKKLYNLHKEMLKASGINISIDELLDIYK